MMNMELMEKKLNDACVEGDVEMLEALMREDKFILARISLSSCFNQTPLHLACMLGHFDFAKSLLSFKPDFASRLDSQGRSPLHLASANGYADVVGLLLLHDQKMCQVRDEDGRTPLHLAVMNGQQESVRELIKVNPESSYDQELHLCVMYNRLDVLILILESGDQDLSCIKYDKGNTILHSAAALRLLEIIKHLVMSRSEDLDVNAVNENGLTALDIIEQMPKDVKTMEIKELLISAGTSRVTEIKTETTTTSHLIPARVASAVADHNIEGAAANEDGSKLVKMVKKFKKISLFPKKQEKKDKNLLVAATVIAAMAYQAAISPPGGVAGLDAKEYNINVPPSSPPSYYLLPTESLFAYIYSETSNKFWIYNTTAFITALSVIFLYVSGASLKGRFFIWLIRLGMWITLSSMTLAYACAVSATTSSPEYINYKPGTPLFVLVIAIVAWITLISLAVLVLVFRIFYYAVRKIITITKRSNRKKKKKNTSEDGAATFSLL